MEAYPKILWPNKISNEDLDRLNLYRTQNSSPATSTARLIQYEGRYTIIAPRLLQVRYRYASYQYLLIEQLLRNEEEPPDYPEISDFVEARRGIEPYRQELLDRYDYDLGAMRDRDTVLKTAEDIVMEVILIHQGPLKLVDYVVDSYLKKLDPPSQEALDQSRRRFYQVYKVAGNIST